MPFSPASTREIGAREIGADGMTYRPDEEMLEEAFRMDDDPTNLARGNRPAPFMRMMPREIFLYGFLVGLFCAAGAVWQAV